MDVRKNDSFHFLRTSFLVVSLTALKIFYHPIQELLVFKVYFSKLTCWKHE